MDLIGRVAIQWFDHTEEASEMDLATKICFVLDEWFYLIGVEREEAQVYEDEGLVEADDQEEKQPNLVRQNVRRLDGIDLD